jgi:hypothetical protein
MDARWPYLSNFSKQALLTGNFPRMSIFPFKPPFGGFPVATFDWSVNTRDAQ